MIISIVRLVTARMTLKRPRAVLFDWDNTLVDTWPVIHQALHSCFTDMGHTPWTLDEVKQRVKHSARDAFPKLFGEDWERAANLYRDYYRAINLEHLKPLPQAEDLLKQLRANNIYMAVVSNKMGDTLRREASHLGWDQYFGELIGSTDTEHDKPHPAPVLKALKELVPAEDIWFVGDSVVDLEVAQRAGITPVLYGPAVLDADKTSHYGNFPFTRHYPEHSHFLKELEGLLFKKQ